MLDGLRDAAADVAVDASLDALSLDEDDFLDSVGFLLAEACDDLSS